MAGTSSSSTPKIPPFMLRNLQIVGNEMEFPESSLNFLSEKIIDFESLSANGFDVKQYFSSQGWDKYFDMLNGPIYPDLLKKFWMKAKVFDKLDAKREEIAAIERDPSLKGKSRKEMGLLDFTGVQIRTNICGMNMAFSPIRFNALLGLPNSGIELDVFEKDTRYRDVLLHLICVDHKLKGKAKGLTDECRVMFRIILAAICPRLGGTDTISWTHRHLLYFLLTRKKVNLGDYFFERICEAINASKSKRHTTIVYPRLLSDLLHQGHVVANLKKFHPKLVKTKFYPEILKPTFLSKMNLIDSKPIAPPQQLSVQLEDRFFVEGYPVISEADAEHVIQDYLEFLRGEGLTVDRSMVPPAPRNMYNPSRKLKRKAEVVDEQAKPDLLAQKKIKVEQSVAEQRTKRKHEESSSQAPDQASKKPVVVEVSSSSDSEDDSETATDSDEEVLAARLKKKPVPISKDKGKSTKFVFNEKEIGLGFTQPLNTVLPSSEPPSSDNPLSELEKHLSPDPLNNQTFTPKPSSPSKPTSPPKPKSPQPEPQPELPLITHSEPISSTPDPIHSEPIQTSPIKQQTPPHISDPASPELSDPEPLEHPIPEPQPTPEYASPERIHTCAPKPSEVEIVTPDNSTAEPTILSTIPNSSPSSSHPFHSLSTQLNTDLVRLSSLQDRFLVCPADVDEEVSAIKARICAALDDAAEDIKSVVGKRDLEVIGFVRDSLAQAELKRLTTFNHEESERAKMEAIAAAEHRLQAFKICWIDSKLFQSLDNQRIESQRLEEAADRVAKLVNELPQEDIPEDDVLAIQNQDLPEVLLLEWNQDSVVAEPPVQREQQPDPQVEDQIQQLQQALREQQEGLERQRAAQETLETKVDGLVSNVGSLNDKFDQLLAFLKKP
ncbi:hypothetical protein L195_g022384 [Trifolium pratense]|uniref:Putative plant transposon protein domain-containing protein n=1 Tax=Trifolium pratense TaxID=57577 RepID=A0A2K3N7U3_TRIPR|nr:hypothetical protein L195_g022384 [Trifolium pratense]